MSSTESNSSSPNLWKRLFGRGKTLSYEQLAGAQVERLGEAAAAERGASTAGAAVAEGPAEGARDPRAHPVFPARPPGAARPVYHVISEPYDAEPDGSAPGDDLPLVAGRVAREGKEQPVRAQDPPARPSSPPRPAGATRPIYHVLSEEIEPGEDLDAPENHPLARPFVPPTVSGYSARPSQRDVVRGGEARGARDETPFGSLEDPERRSVSGLHANTRSMLSPSQRLRDRDRNG